MSDTQPTWRVIENPEPDEDNEDPEAGDDGAPVEDEDGEDGG